MKKFSDIVTFGSSFRAAQVEEKVFSPSPACASPKGRTLLFVSDVHLCDMFPHASAERLLEQIASLHPDMLLLGGDYAESPALQRDFFRMLSEVPAPLGKYGVIGNNDSECFPDNLCPLFEMAQRAGVTLLNNRTVRVNVDGASVSIAGLSDFQYGTPNEKPLFCGRDESALRILLSHYPQSVAQYLAQGHPFAPHLAMAGHTHGGQFSLLGLTPYSVGFEWRMRGIRLPAVRGWRSLGDTELLVSSGIGTSRLPFRVNVLPEIHRIFL